MKARCRICEVDAEHELTPDFWMSASVRKNVLRCGACGSYYLDPIPEPAEISTCYADFDFSGWAAEHAKSYYRGVLLGRRLRKLKPRGRLLDVGCAIGSVIEGVQSVGAWAAEGIELTPQAVQMAHLRGLTVHEGFIHGNTLRPASYDYICAYNLIEHDPQPVQLFAEVNRLLKTGGLFDVVIPYGPTDIYPTLRLARQGFRVGPHHPGHLNFFTPKGITEIARKNGFSVVSSHSYHLVMTLKKRFLWPGSRRRWLRKLSVPDGTGGLGGPEGSSAHAETSGPSTPEQANQELRLPGRWRALRYNLSLRYKRLFFHRLPPLGQSYALVFRKD